MTIALPVRSTAQLVENVDPPGFEIHVDVASQVDLATLRVYLENAKVLVHGTQQSNDVACCSTIEAASLPTFGNSGDGLDVINNRGDWNRLGNSGAFIVQSIQWCGTPGTNIIGCGLTPGNKLAIALDASASIRGVVIAHERGHNAGLTHREDESCALMFPSAGSTHGCLNASECTSIRNLGSPGGACPCHGASVGDPPLDGATCDDGDGCTQTDTCQAGLCSGSNPLVCTALDPCHDAGACDPGTGVCSDPPKPDGATCDDGDLCTQTDTCQSGACTGASPVVCTALDACHAAGACEPATGICSDPLKANGATCDDGDPSTTGEVCQAGICIEGLPVPTVGPLGRGIVAVGLVVAALVAGSRARRARRSARPASGSRL